MRRAVLLLTSAARAQQPFYSDDADVTDLDRFHVDWSNQFNWFGLRRGLLQLQAGRNYELVKRVRVLAIQPGFWAAF